MDIHSDCSKTANHSSTMTIQAATVCLNSCLSSKYAKDLVQAHNNFKHDTPSVCKGIVTAFALCWFSSLFVVLSNLVECTFELAFLDIQLHRLITSPFVTSNIFSTFLCYDCLIHHICPLEKRVGTTRVLLLCILSTTLTNFASCIISCGLAVLFDNDAWLSVGVSGVWVVFLPLVAIECMQHPSASERMLFKWPLPKKCFPIVVTCFFCLCRWNILPYVPSLFVGYAMHFIFLNPKH